jgi:2-keto-4-pentenoate hydratase/2-oxohepta-3-ene-1,7-dioic acid hydratase in catechol pathway
MARPIRKSFRHDVLTGSPARVGLPHGEFLKPGDKVIATAEGVGELHTEIA